MYFLIVGVTVLLMLVDGIFNLIFDLIDKHRE